MAITARQKKNAIALAKDVLKRLSKRYYNVEEGSYCVVGTLENEAYQSDAYQSDWDPDQGCWEQDEKRKPGEVRDGDDLKKALPKLKHCQVCAMGALFLAYVAKEDKVRVKYDYGGSEIKKLLAGYIGNEQVYSSGREYSYEFGPVERDFEDGKKGTPRQRLRRIMKNILKNKGVYVPDETTT